MTPCARRLRRGAWRGWLHLQGFQDRVAAVPALAATLCAALLATILVTALAAWCHVRQALALRPIEALA